MLTEQRKEEIAEISEIVDSLNTEEIDYLIDLLKLVRVFRAEGEFRQVRKRFLEKLAEREPNHPWLSMNDFPAATTSSELEP